MISPTQSAEMTAALATLNERYTQALTKHRDTFYFPGLGTADAAEGWLYTSRKMIDYLAGEMRSDVMAGRKTLAEWQTLAHEANALLAKILGGISALSFSAVGGDLVQGVKDAATFALVGTSGVLLVGAALALFVLFRPVRA